MSAENKKIGFTFTDLASLFFFFVIIFMTADFVAYKFWDVSALRYINNMFQ
jgi:hypothetical protein